MKSMILVRVLQASLYDIPINWKHIERVCKAADSYSWPEFLALVVGVLMLALYGVLVFVTMLDSFVMGASFILLATWALYWVVAGGLK
jgi:hypothetical protein